MRWLFSTLLFTYLSVILLSSCSLPLPEAVAAGGQTQNQPAIVSEPIMNLPGVPHPAGVPLILMPTEREQMPPGWPASVVAQAERRAPCEVHWRLHLVNLYHPLPDGYTPPLTAIAPRFRVERSTAYHFDSRAIAALEEMLTVARAAGVNIYVTSAHRSQQLQREIFNASLQDYRNMGLLEASALYRTARLIAYPATSEHQLGLAVDLVTRDHMWLHESFEETAAFHWLVHEGNARAHGFILRYPQESTHLTGIAYEPWHFRYIGREHSYAMWQLGYEVFEEYLDYLTQTGAP